MTPSERERRIEAAAKAISDQFEQGYRSHWCAEWQKDGRCERCTEVASAALDAADEAVPVVPATWDGLLEHLDAMYPADVFSGESGDVGARLVVLARKLIAAEAALVRLGSGSTASTPRPAITERNKGER